MIVLWSVVLLTLLGAGIVASGRGEAQLAGNLRAAASAEAAADGGVYEAAYHLLDPAAPWPANAQPVAIARPGAAVTLCVVNESGKINPNRANPGLMQALLHELGVDAPAASRLAAAIYDWRSPASRDAAQVQRYRSAGLARAPTGAPFASLDELGAVLGMTPAILRRVRPYLSVLTDTDPDPEAASPFVVRAIRDVVGIDPSVAAQPAPPRTVTVSAMAETGQGNRFIRRAALRLGTESNETPVTVLTWNTVDGTKLPSCR